MIRKKMLVISILLCSLALSGCTRAPIIISESRVTDAAKQEQYADRQDPETQVHNSDADPEQPFIGAQEEQAADLERSAETNMQAGMLVHVCGAVNAPGVYELPEDARIVNAVEAAGGFREDADNEWFNLASPVHDGDQVRIYTKEETEFLRNNGAASMEHAAEALQNSDQNDASGSGLLDLNTASLTELTKLPGIGEVRAGEIIAYREAHGGFGSIEEIKEISGIKDNLFGRIRDLITVSHGP